MPVQPVQPAPASATSRAAVAPAPASSLALLPGFRTLASPRFRLAIAATLAALGVLILGAAMLRQASLPGAGSRPGFG